MSLVDKIVEALELVNSLNYIDLGKYADINDETSEYIVVQVSEDKFHLVGKTEDIVFIHLGECRNIQYYVVEGNKVQYPIKIKPSMRYIEFTNGVMYNDVYCISFKEVPKYLLANYLQIK